MGKPGPRSMATTCKQAIANFEADRIRNKEGKKADECQVVKLYFQKPPIAKLDGASLATLKACEHLAVSTNCIEKMVNLAGMENLKILSLSRNKLKKIEQLDSISDRLEQLWISYNNITTLAGVEQCGKLRVIFAGNNNISDIRELSRLQSLPSLEELVLYGNPLQKKIEADDGATGWAEKVLTLLPNLRRLDGVAAVQWRTKINEGNDLQLKELFDKMDADGSGGLTLTEVKDALDDSEIRRRSMISKEKADELFSNMDGDGSGVIDWEEFRKYFSTKRKMSATNMGL